DKTIVPTVRMIGPARWSDLAWGALRQPRVAGPLARTEWGGTQHQPPVVPSGDFMATATATAPSREDFAKLLEESFGSGSLQEGSVIKGTVVGIEKELAVIDVGLKTEGRVALREFQAPG